MRNADLSIDEDEAENLLVEIQKQLKKRQWGEVIRLEAEEKMDKRLLKILKTEFDIRNEDIFSIAGPLDLTVLMKVYGLEGFEKYKSGKYVPAPVPQFQTDKNIFEVIREGDVFLHHPYMSFDPVVNFVRQAAKNSGSSCNQADALPCQRKLTYYCGVGSGSRKRQAGNGFGRAEGTV